MAEFENREKRPRGAPSGAQDENSALAELSRFVDAQKNRGEQGRERRGRPSAEIRRERSNPAERAGSQARKRYGDDDSAPIDAASARAKDFRNRNAVVRAPRGSIGPPPRLHRLRSRHAAPFALFYGVDYRHWLCRTSGKLGFLAKAFEPDRDQFDRRETEEPDRNRKKWRTPTVPLKTLPLSTHSPLDVSSDDRGASSAPVGIPTSSRRRSRRRKRRRARRRRRSRPAPNMTIPAMSWRRSKKSRRRQNYCSTRRRR